MGAEPHERSGTRVTQRNGTRSKTITTAAGDLDLSITKLRTESFFPSLLERRRRIEQALFAVIMEAYVTGTSVQKVDDLVKALGADTGISKSEVSRICADLDEQVASFADRDLSETGFPYLSTSASSSTSSPPCSADSSPRSNTCSARPPRTSPRSPTSPSVIGRRSGRPTRSSGSRRRSSAAPDVVGVFPNPAALLRLAGCVLIEVHDEWQVSDRRYLSEGSMALIDAQPDASTSDQPTLEITQEVATTGVPPVSRTP